MADRDVILRRLGRARVRLAVLVSLAVAVAVAVRLALCGRRRTRRAAVRLERVDVDLVRPAAGLVRLAVTGPVEHGRLARTVLLRDLPRSATVPVELGLRRACRGP